jgi:hypothetical protein
LRKFYLEFKLSSLQIEALTNFKWDKVSIIGALRKANIKRNRLPSRIKFGEKIVHGQRVPHLGEQKIIQEIISLRESKMTLRAIADCLNQRSTPTKLGGKWNKTTIGDILKRYLKRKV